MMLRPVVARLGRKFGKVDLLAMASETIEISPAIMSDRPSACYAAGELERIKAYYEAAEFELARVHGGKRSEGATLGYAIDNAVVSRGAVYKGMAGIFLRDDAPKFLDRGRLQNQTEAVLATNATCERYFGDWLMQSLCLRLIARDFKLPAIDMKRKPYLHQPGYEKAAGLPSNAIQSARFERLWIIDDRGMNGSQRERLIELRHRVRSAAIGPERSHRGVFLHRGRLGKGRFIINEAEVIEFLTRRGFVIIEPEHIAVSEIVDAVRDAAVVLTVEGSAQMHALVAMPEGGCLAIIQPADRFTLPGKDVADLVNIRYAFMVADTAESGLHVDIARLGRMLDLAGA